jgi:dynein light chain LC8-type
MAAASAAAGKKKKKGAVEEDEVPAMPMPEVLASDLPLADQEKVFRMTAVARSKEKIEKDQATHIKKELETAFGGMWHCILGACYGVSITNETKSMLFFKTGLKYVLVFRTLDEEQQAVDNAPPPSGDGALEDDDLDAVEDATEAGAAAE